MFLITIGGNQIKELLWFYRMKAHPAEVSIKSLRVKGFDAVVRGEAFGKGKRISCTSAYLIQPDHFLDIKGLVAGALDQRPLYELGNVTVRILEIDGPPVREMDDLGIVISHQAQAFGLQEIHRALQASRGNEKGEVIECG